MADDHGLLAEPIDDVGVVTRDVIDADVGHVFRVFTGLGHRVRLSWPAWSDGGVSGLPEQLDPRIPAGRVQPEAVNEDNWDCAHRVTFQIFGIGGAMG